MVSAMPQPEDNKATTTTITTIVHRILAGTLMLLNFFESFFRPTFVLSGRARPHFLQNTASSGFCILHNVHFFMTQTIQISWSVYRNNSNTGYIDH